MRRYKCIQEAKNQKTKNMEPTAIISFLNSFFLMFKARIDEHKIVDDEMQGIVSWENEEDRQEFSLSLINLNIPPNVTVLCDYLSKNNLLHGDCMIISDKDLLTRLIATGWEMEIAQKSIDYLFSFSVNMLDDGVKTDCFFIHFNGDIE